MDLFGEDTTIDQRKDRSLYLIGRLRRAGYEDLLVPLGRAREAYVTQERVLADARNPVVLAMADRDAADDTLDEVAQSASATLRGRSPNAAREEPYTQVVPHGLEAITLASITETPGAYRGLVERATRFLPAGDEVRERLERLLPALIADFEAASALVGEVSRAQSTQQLAFDAVEAELDRTYERVAGALIERVGKKKADRFFLRPAKKARRSVASPE